MREKKLCLNGCFKVKPVAEFTSHPKSPDGLAALCKSCVVKRAQIRRHGLSAQDKSAIAERQGGCVICGRAEPGGHGWVVDHDHRCCPGAESCVNCRRGIICPRCNSALGYAQDSPELLRKMADYLESGIRLTELNESIESLLGVSQLSLLTESHEEDERTDVEGSLLQNMSHVFERARATGRK